MPQHVRMFTKRDLKLIAQMHRIASELVDTAADLSAPNGATATPRRHRSKRRRKAAAEPRARRTTTRRYRRDEPPPAPAAGSEEVPF